MATGATKNLAGVIVCRAFLGCFEAAFGAGGPYLLSLFYRRQELGKRVAILMGTSPLANCFAATLAYGILHIQGSIEAWRLLFIIGKSSSSRNSEPLPLTFCLSLRGRPNCRILYYRLLLPARRAPDGQVSHRRGAEYRVAPTRYG